MSRQGSRAERRPYRSTQRKAQADATRRGILAAASHAFSAHGYAATSIDRIARDAGVAPETVYSRFGNKRSILAALVDIAVAGDDEPVPLLERDWVRQLAVEPALDGRVELLALHGTAILARRSGVDSIVDQAAGGDADVAVLRLELRAQRRAGQARLLDLVAGPGGLREGLDARAASDILFAVGSPEVFRALTRDAGWTTDAFQAWYADAIRRLLLRG